MLGFGRWCQFIGVRILICVGEAINACEPGTLLIVELPVPGALLSLLDDCFSDSFVGLEGLVDAECSFVAGNALC